MRGALAPAGLALGLVAAVAGGLGDLCGPRSRCRERARAASLGCFAGGA